MMPKPLEADENFRNRLQRSENERSKDERPDDRDGKSAAKREKAFRETLKSLEEEAQKQISLQVRMRGENVRLKNCVELQEHRKEEEQRSLLDLQGSVKNLSAARADLAARLAEVDSSKKDLEKQLAGAQEESSSFGRQLEMEKEVHQKEVSHPPTTQQEGKAQQDRYVHGMLRLYQQEQEELEALAKYLKSEAVADSELRRALQLKLDKMRTECDKLTEQLSTSEENHAKLLRKYHSLKKELDVKAKLQWLCEEVRERESRERRLRRTLQQHNEQMKALKQSKDSELQSLLDRITLQDWLLKEIQSEKRGLLEMGRKKENEMRNLQDRIVDLEMSTRLALDHLESVPEKLSLLENFKDLEESQKQREMVEQRYAKYKEIVGNLQHQFEESKRRIQEYRDKKLDSACQSPAYWSDIISAQSEQFPDWYHSVYPYLTTEATCQSRFGIQSDPRALFYLQRSKL